MRVLVDTHVWLWMQTEPERIEDECLALLSDVTTEVLLSAASAWEIAIQYALGRLALPESPSRYVPDRMRTSATTALPILPSHAVQVAELPMHHRDPFDRLLVAQAQLEAIPLITADPLLAQYEIEVIRAA